MTCILGIDKDGNRFIACTRGSRPRPGLDMDDNSNAPLFPNSPWRTGAQVEHKAHGFGVVHSRTEDQVGVIFKKDPPGKVRHFVLSLVGESMRVCNLG